MKAIKDLVRGGFSLLCLMMMFTAFACAEGDTTAPSSVDDLTFFNRADAVKWNGRVRVGDTLSGSPNTRLLAWTSVGDDGDDGRASTYDIRFVRARDLRKMGLANPRGAFEHHWDALNQIYGERYPRENGELEQMLLPRLSGGDTLWFSIRTVDEIGQRSEVGKVAGPFVLPRLAVPLENDAGAAAGLGSALMGAADFNNDGYPDLIVGSPAEGKAYLYKGRRASQLFERAVNANGVKVNRAIARMRPWVAVTGSSADEFGAAVAGLGKVNSDNKYDVAVGAPGAGSDAGAVYVRYGQNSPPPTPTAAGWADAVLTGELAGDRFGSALAPGFDLDNDNRSEAVVGAPSAYATGAVYIFKGLGLASGPASGAEVIIKGANVGDGFGAVVANVSDVNGDGVPDLAVGAPGVDMGSTTDAGAVYVFYGGNMGIIQFPATVGAPVVIDLAAAKADVTIKGTSPGGAFGRSLAALGQTTGAGGVYYDFAAGAADTVFAYLGGPLSTVPFPLHGSSVEARDIDAAAVLAGAPGSDFGRSVAGLHDVNQDGKADLGVGAPNEDAFYVFYGSLYDGKPADETLAGPAGSDFGWASAGIGDMNQDGYPDLIIGAPLMGRGFFWF